MPKVVICELTEEALNVDRLYQAVRDSKFGGVVVFSGEVRSMTGAEVTHSLDYEAYASMAVTQMQRIAENAATRHQARVAVAHRIGHLNPGDVAVVCAAASAHRDAAFACAKELIDQIKADVPIWKKDSESPSPPVFPKTRGDGLG